MANPQHKINVNENNYPTKDHNGENLLTTGILLASMLINIPGPSRRKRSTNEGDFINTAANNLFFKVL